jgi:hypothetical protein
MTREQAEKIAKQIASDYAKYQNTSWSLVEAITEALTATSVKVPELKEIQKTSIETLGLHAPFASINAFNQGALWAIKRMSNEEKEML